MSAKLLEVEDLKVGFDTDDGLLRAVDGVSFSLSEGEILGIVGESGSGKSVSMMALMRLLPMPPARILGGHIQYRGQNLLNRSEKEMRALRGSEISMIFQDPFTSLNPYLRISTQMMEVLQAHSTMTEDQARRRCLEVLEQLGVSDAEVRFRSYPHQLSGGLKQRIMIAMSLLLKPKILIADEPTTALDVTIQAQILELLKEINRSHGTTLILITHDLGVVAGLCSRVQVMYGGRLVESGTVDEIFESTKHPYTRGLMNSIPHLDAEVGSKLTPIAGNPPDLARLPEGCAFQPRCFKAEGSCLEIRPSLSAGSHRFACHFPLSQGEVLNEERLDAS